jgi:hypothetical protein
MKCCKGRLTEYLALVIPLLYPCRYITPSSLLGNSINLLSIIITFVVSAGAGFLIGVMLIIGMKNQIPID